MLAPNCVSCAFFRVWGINYGRLTPAATVAVDAAVAAAIILTLFL